ncbi:MAG: hypothetical protein WAR01_01255, partial [Dokdonella sp.]|uniref:hypothetical protein n=1 Tax=Dokdonella sp. TaxID=2291710 RepID=UPI003BAFFD0E
MDGLYACNAGAVAGDGMGGLHARNAQAWAPASHDYRARAGSLYSTRVITQRRSPCGVCTS